MTLFAIRSYPQGPRVWIVGQRVHHGATGCVVLAAALTRKRTRALALLGLAAMLHDRHDWRVWFVREALEIAGSVTEASQSSCVTNVTHEQAVSV